MGLSAFNRARRRAQEKATQRVEQKTAQEQPTARAEAASEGDARPKKGRKEKVAPVPLVVTDAHVEPPATAEESGFSVLPAHLEEK
jgi:hypothetical protein